MEFEQADDYKTERRRGKINEILRCFYGDEDEDPIDCMITDESCLSDWMVEAEEIEKIKAKFPKFENSMVNLYLWEVADKI